MDVPNQQTERNTTMIQMQAKDLYQAVKSVKRTEVHTLPVLNHALIQLTSDGMKVTTIALTDDGKDIATETARYMSNGERWETCVPMVHKCVTYPNGGGMRDKSTRKFYPFLDWLKVMAEYNETLSIEFESAIQTLKINAGGSRTEFKCLDAQEFPPV